MQRAGCLHEAKQAFALEGLHPKGGVVIPPDPAVPRFGSLGFAGPRGDAGDGWVNPGVAAGAARSRGRSQTRAGTLSALPAASLLTALSMVKTMFKHVLN